MNTAKVAPSIPILRRIGWGVGDQAVSSISTFAVSAVVARELGATRFGAFTVAFVTYSLLVNACRGVATDPLLVRFSGQPTDAWRRAVAAATATATLVGFAGGALCLLVGLILPADVGRGFIALSIGMPGLALQDSWRFCFFSIGRGAKALVLDLVWTVLLLGALYALVITHHSGVISCMLVFGGTATLAAGFGLWQTKILPRPGLVLGWLRKHQSLGGRYFLENLAVGGSRQLRTFAIGAVAGLAVVGSVRAAELLMGPFLVILMGVSQVSVPEASHVLKRAPHRLKLFCFALGGVQSIAAAAWGVAMIVLLPMGAGSLLLGPLWVPAAALLPAVTVAICLGAVSTGATTGLRAMGASPRSLFAQLSCAALYVSFTAVGAYFDDARGACWGYAFATLLGTGIWWIQLARGHAELSRSAALGAGAPVSSGVLP